MELKTLPTACLSRKPTNQDSRRHIWAHGHLQHHSGQVWVFRNELKLNSHATTEEVGEGPGEAV